MNLRPVIAFAAGLVACGGSGASSSRDAASTDANQEDVGLDGGMCVGDTVLASCFAHFPGWTCDVPCELPPSCWFRLTISWTGDECGDRTDQLTCVCSDGAPLCWEGPPGGPRQRPSYTFELCAPPDAGTDAGIDDAGMDDADTSDRDASPA